MMQQEYDKYTNEDFKVWKQLYERQIVNLPNAASQAYLDGLQQINFTADKIPNFEETNDELKKLTGWSIHVVPGLIDDDKFFQLLSNRKFPSSTWLRKLSTMFRSKENALMPNWKHMPIAYHGRASSIVVSGTNIHRPKGQILLKGADQPVFSPTRALDFELEMAAVIGKENKLGTSVRPENAEDYIFGFVLFNDWSARDIQRWEYVPLGPFLGKSFASSISPWVVPLEALQPFRVDGPEQKPKPLSYLRTSGKQNFNINLEVAIQPEEENEVVVSRTNFKNMYWSVSQMLAHHTVNGCNMRVGDLLASGTISGNKPDSYGSLLELSWNGEQPLKINSNQPRTYLEDGDTVTLRGYAEQEGIRVGFGEVRTKILPSL